MTFHQLLLPLSFESNRHLDHFIVDDSNWEAFAWIRRWPEWPFKHLVIHGEPKSGKTYLAHAFQEISKAHWIAVDDLNQTPNTCIQKGSAFIIDNYDDIRDENWLFHFYNLTKEHQADVLYCGRHSPAQSLFKLPDLASRMRSVLSIPIHQPEELLLKKLFKQRLDNFGISLPTDFDDICHYLLNRIERSYLMLDTLIIKMNEFLLREQRVFSLPLVREVLNQNLL